MSKSYNIVLNSAKNYSVGASQASVTYAIDCHFLEPGQYEVHFTFVSNVLNVTGSDVGNIFINFGGNQQSFHAFNTTTASSINYLGITKPYIIGTSSFLLAEDNTNPPIFLNGRPTNNLFTVEVYQNDFTTLFTPATGSFPDYVLHLKFYKI